MKAESQAGIQSPRGRQLAPAEFVRQVASWMFYVALLKPASCRVQDRLRFEVCFWRLDGFLWPLSELQCFGLYLRPVRGLD